MQSGMSLCTIPGMSKKIHRPLIMGIVNITPDSFSDGGKFLQTQAALAHCDKLLGDGADILDLGAESTRPGSDPVSEEEEWARLKPVLEGLDLKKVRVSVDTTKPRIQKKALEMGVFMINDVSGGSEELFSWAEKAQASVCIMHSPAPPKTMQNHTDYQDVMEDLKDWFSHRRPWWQKYRVPVYLDPGIGFGKTLTQNLRLMRECMRFAQGNERILMGVSRKSWIRALLGDSVLEPSDRDSASLAAHLCLSDMGVDVLRVHDVLGLKHALVVREALAISEHSRQYLELNGLHVSTVIGVLEEEMLNPQTLHLDLKIGLFPHVSDCDSLENGVDYVKVCDAVRDFCAHQSSRTLESFARNLKAELMALFPCQSLVLRVHKPRYAKTLQVEDIVLGCES